MLSEEKHNNYVRPNKITAKVFALFYWVFFGQKTNTYICYAYNFAKYNHHSLFSAQVFLLFVDTRKLCIGPTDNGNVYVNVFSFRCL